MSGPLHTRSKHDKHDKADKSGVPLSFKVKGQDLEEERGRERQRNDPVDSPHADLGVDPMEEDEEEVEVEEDDGMAALMGFGGFGTTKNKKVVGNNTGAIRKEKKTEYRQYMNRVGGFNRPLSPSR